MINDISKAFISGCCWPVFVPFFWGFKSLKSQYNNKNMEQLLGNIDPYFLYTIVAPIYFGLMSIITVVISTFMKTNIRLSYFITSLISPILISLFIRLNDLYVFSDKRWIKQYILLLTFHSFAYNVIIANIYKFIN